jgi:hypothetical protein
MHQHETLPEFIFSVHAEVKQLHYWSTENSWHDILQQNYKLLFLNLDIYNRKLPKHENCGRDTTYNAFIYQISSLNKI